MAFSDSSKSAEFPLVTDELEYQDPAIPKKLHSSFLPNELLKKFVIESWSGEEHEIYDNAAEIYDSMKFEDEIELLGKPESSQNFRFEKVEKNPSVLHSNMYFGRAKADFKNGMQYTGEVSYSLIHGRGTLKGEGFKYVGTFRNSEIEGEGRYEWENCIYEGEVKRGLRNGEGHLNFENGTSYSGQWREGLREGFGKLTYAKGQYYEGNWTAGKKQGYGVFKYPSGNYYEGYFFEDKRHGKGTMHWVARNEKYSGDWREGLQNGYGVHIWLDPQGNKQLRNRYVGQWANGKRNGYGVFYYADGSKYEGMWVNDRKHGEGTMTFEDGSVYSGVFENDHIPNKNSQVKVEESPVQTPAASKKPILKPPQSQQSQTKKSAEVNPVPLKKPRRNVESNPFETILDIKDLTTIESDPEKAEKEVQKILLKHNSDLKSWYNMYSSQVEVKEKEEGFNMTARQFWRFLRDTRVISYKVPIANVNRLFLQGSKNQFSIASTNPETETDQSIVKDTSHFSQAFPPNLDISNIPNQEDLEDTLSEPERLEELELEDIHYTERPILMRHFVEAVVRVAFLKYSNGGFLRLENEVVKKGDKEITVERPKSQIGIALFKLLNERIVKNIGKSCKEEESKVETGLQLMQTNGVEEVFSAYMKKDRGICNGKRDDTIEVRALLQLCSDKGIVPTLLSTEEVLEEVERYHDPEYSYTKLCKDERHEAVKNRVLQKLLGSELVLFEFYEVLTNIALRVIQDQSVDKGIQRFVKRVLFSNTSISIKLTEVPQANEDSHHSEAQKPRRTLKKPQRKCPKSQKQLLIDQKKQERQKELDQIAEEQKAMQENDCNIPSEPEESNNI